MRARRAHRQDHPPADHAGLSEQTHRRDAERRFQVRDEIFERGRRQCAKVRAVGVGVARPAKRTQHPNHDAIGLVPVPVIVEAPDHQAMVVNQLALELVDWVVLEPGRLVEVIVEGWLVHDDEVGTLGDRLFDHRIACQKRCDDAPYRLMRIAGLNGVDGIERGVVGRRGEGHVDDLLNG
jgi:hypothetical protein